MRLCSCGWCGCWNKKKSSEEAYKPVAQTSQNGTQQNAQSQPQPKQVAPQPDTSTSTQPPKPAKTQQTPQPSQSLGPFASKVDSALFNVEDSKKDGVTLLRCTAKEGQSPVKFFYDGKELWNRGNTVVLTLVLVYFKDGQPHLVMVSGKDKNAGNGYTFFRYKDDKGKWKDGDETTHKKKLDELKKGTPAVATPKTPPST